MSRFFGVFTDRYKLFAYVFLITVGALLLSLYGRGIEATLAISAGIGLVLFITKSVWFSDKYGETTVRILSLGIAASAAFAFAGWPALVESYLKPILEEQYPALQNNFDTLPPFVFGFLAFIIYIVNNFRSDQTGMGVHPTPLDRDVPEPSFKDRLKAVCGALTDDLKSIDTKTNWSARYFTPLDAEVEVNTPNGKERKVTDLLKAIRQSQKRLFLVLGTPGAGKSVALRKLCQDLAEEVTKTGKIPVYINLREWHVAQKWSEHSPPTVEQLYQFVFENLKSRDIVTSKFFDKYFERLYETGRLYFVLDSFDEIPAVLDEKENSELIHQLSEVIFKFLKGARQAEAQGILASRLFRKPTHEFQTEVTLEIRPFTEQKIISTFENYGIFTKSLIKTLFKDRPELVPIARNPFSAVLIAEYADNNQNQLPPNQSEMYTDYFDRTLNSAADRIRRKNLTKDQVVDYTIEIASTMFEHYGLEAPVNQLVDRLKPIPVEDVIDILKFARLGRLGTGDENIFSFSHRRFVEYFSVQKIIRENKSIDLESIPTDSQWRDALVLYCEVASVEKATIVANFCWGIIENFKNPRDIRVIHSLRFLRDAFKARPECLISFNKKLADYIYNQINVKNSMISVKIALETVSILAKDDIDNCVSKAINLYNPLLEEAIINSCRNLPSISKELNKKIKGYLFTREMRDIVINRRNLLFSFSLSEAFKQIRTNIIISIILYYMFLLSSIIFFIRLKFVMIFLITLLTLMSMLKNSLRKFRDTLEVHMALAFIAVCLSFSLNKFIPAYNHYAYEKVCSIYRCYTVADIPYLKNIELNEYGFLPKQEKITILDEKINTPLREESILFFWAMLIVSLLFLLRPHESFFNSSFVKKFKSKEIKNTFAIIILSVIFFLFIVYYFQVFFAIYSVFFKIIILGLMVFSLLYFVFHSINKYIFYILESAKVDYSKLNKREDIQLIVYQVESDKLKRNILQYIENNIKNVTGEWPDSSFLNCHNNDYVSIRLARMEEKWLGLDR